MEDSREGVVCISVCGMARLSTRPVMKTHAPTQPRQVGCIMLSIAFAMQYTSERRLLARTSIDKHAPPALMIRMA